jgi:hypothetical protein
MRYAVSFDSGRGGYVELETFEQALTKFTDTIRANPHQETALLDFQGRVTGAAIIGHYHPRGLPR